MAGLTLRLFRYAYASSVDCGRSERINESATVPARDLLKSQVIENWRCSAFGKRRPFGALMQLVTARFACTHRVERRLRGPPRGAGTTDSVTLSIRVKRVYRVTETRDTDRWASRVGCHGLERISKSPKGQLSRDRNSVMECKRKSCPDGSPANSGCRD